ncbi:MAG: hypothetical protein WC828_06435 [Thermoleophilia bacterium]|jgi:hypothetical protein
MSKSPTLALAIYIVIAGISAIASIAYAGPEVGLNVSPTHLAPVIPAGDTTSETVVLENSSTEEMIVSGNIDNSTLDSSDITQIRLDPEQISLKPGQTSAIELSINVPAGAEAGQRRSMILFDVRPASGRDVSIVGQVAVVLDIKTIHPVDDVHFTFPHIIDSTDAVTFTMQGRNAGNFPAGLQGKADIDGLFGKYLVVNAASENINIGQSAKMDSIWDKSPLFGVGKVTVKLSSGVGAPVEQSSWFLVFPWKICVMIIFIAGAGFAGAHSSPVFTKVFSLKRRKES